MTRKVLIVDDEEDIRRVLRWVLGSIGAVLEAANGPDALKLIAEEKPGLVLLDVAMPEMGGLEVLAAARALDPRVVVVMLTGLEDLEIAKRALDGGAKSYITKPFEAEALRDEIKRALDPDFEKTEKSGRPWKVAGKAT
jgi:YesN/AraC family two-component response regulator